MVDLYGFSLPYHHYLNQATHFTDHCSLMIEYFVVQGELNLFSFTHSQQTSLREAPFN
jgi:hypothetical protein